MAGSQIQSKQSNLCSQSKFPQKKKKERKLEAEKQARHDEKLSQIMQLAENIGLDAALRKLEE